MRYIAHEDNGIVVNEHDVVALGVGAEIFASLDLVQAAWPQAVVQNDAESL